MSNRSQTASVLIPPLSPAFISADDAAVYAHELITTIKNGVVYGGFILARQNRYYATLPKAGSALSFDPANVLTLSDDGLFLPIEGYTIEAMYHSNTSIYRVPWQVHEESQLQDNFFSIQDLNLAIRYRHNYPRFYLSCPDKCVLSYIASGSALEQALLPLLSRTRPQYPGTFERAYDVGSLMPSHLIGLICLAGTLSIVLPGARWARRTRLGANWKIDQQNGRTSVDMPPLCESVFSDVLDAVKAVQRHLRLRKHVQFAGYVLKHADTQDYVCTRPLETPYFEFDRDVLFPKDASGVPVLPEGYSIVGVYLSGEEPDVLLHESTNELFGDFFSPRALLTSLLLVRATPGCEVFFCAREGGLLRYQVEASEAEAQLLARLNRVHNTLADIEANLFPYDSSTVAYVHCVAQAGKLDVIIADEVWAQVGRVGPDWAPFVVSGGQAVANTPGKKKRFAYAGLPSSE